MIRISSEKKDGVWFSLALNERQKLIACSFSDRNRREAEKAVKRTLPRGMSKIENGHMPNFKRFLEIYGTFKGKRVAVDLNALDLSHVSRFQKRVYLLLRRIPRGRVASYGALATRLGGRWYARAVGTAVASNPLPLIIPCHRVVPASLAVGNYGMPGLKPPQGGYMKRKLLEREGVKFLGAKVSKESVWSPN